MIISASRIALRTTNSDLKGSSSTEHAVTFLTDSIRMNSDKGYLTEAVFIDLRKAFDNVGHARLLSMLQRMV